MACAAEFAERTSGRLTNTVGDAILEQITKWQNRCLGKCPHVAKDRGNIFLYDGKLIFAEQLPMKGTEKGQDVRRRDSIPILRFKASQGMQCLPLGLVFTRFKLNEALLKLVYGGHDLAARR